MPWLLAGNPYGLDGMDRFVTQSATLVPAGRQGEFRSESIRRFRTPFATKAHGLCFSTNATTPATKQVVRFRASISQLIIFHVSVVTDDCRCLFDSLQLWTIENRGGVPVEMCVCEVE